MDRLVGPFTFEGLGEEIDRQTLAVGSLGGEPTGTLSVYRFCAPWVERDGRGHPYMDPRSFAALAPNFRAWQATRHDRQIAHLRQFMNQTSGAVR